MLTRLYCPQLNRFVEPSNRNVVLWFQQQRGDHTIATLQTWLLYESFQRISLGKYWDAEKHEIRYSKPKKAKVSGRYRLYLVPWSGMYDREKRRIFHGDILHESDSLGPLVCDVGAGSIRFIRHDTGLFWQPASTLDLIDQAANLRIVDSAILNPNMVGPSIRALFTYTNEES